jgi:ligand-binding sensor protein
MQALPYNIQRATIQKQLHPPTLYSHHGGIYATRNISIIIVTYFSDILMSNQTRPNQASNTAAEHMKEGVDVIDLKLADLVDMAELNLLLDNFCNSVGIASAIIDLQGEVLTASRWQRICTDFHRINETTCARCIESDTDLALQLKAGENFSVYKCKNGMTDAASPIIIEGRHLANVFVGQFLLTSPDHEFFGYQAGQVGFDRQAFFRALDEVPIVSEEILPSILGFLSGFASLVASMGLQRLRAERVSSELSKHRKKLKQLVKLRSSELELQNRILEQIGSGVSLSSVLDTLSRQVELLHPEMRCSILLLDEAAFSMARPSSIFNRAADGLKIGWRSSCGRQPIVASALLWKT